MNSFPSCLPLDGLQTYPPFQALNMPIGLFGPAPYMPQSCICGRFIVEDYCACAAECWKMPKHTWATANPIEYELEQAVQRRYMRQHQFWIQQCLDFHEKFWKRAKPVVEEYERLLDQESSMGCHACQTNGYACCKCHCDSCGSKYCTGDCSCDQEWVY